MGIVNDKSRRDTHSDRQTEGQKDIATTGLNRPLGTFSEKGTLYDSLIFFTLLLLHISKMQKKHKNLSKKHLLTDNLYFTTLLYI